MRAFLTLIVVAALGAGGYFVWKKWAARNSQSAATRPISKAIVEARDISFSIIAAGEIGPADQVSVRPEINGKIAELPVDIGDQVKRGQLLCRLDDTDLQTEKESRLSEIAGARLQIEAAALAMAKTEREFLRSKELHEARLVSQEIFDNARTDFDVAKNQHALAKNALERAEKALKQVEDKLAKTRIEAPFDCTVLTRPVSLGQTVSGAAGFNSGTEVLTIANLNDMIITAHINQADVTRMKVGQRVDVQVESVPGLHMRAEVERIAPQALIKNGIKGFSARIAIKELDPRVRPGMTSILTIPVASVENALSVPLSAVFTERSERYVYVKDGEEFERRSVQIGISDLSFAEVQQGLGDGDIVALEMPADIKEEKAPKAGKGTNGMTQPRPATAAQPAQKKA
jgi:HlyD family secretion protein